MNHYLHKKIFSMRPFPCFQLSLFRSNKLSKVRISLKKVKPYTIFLPSVKSIQTKKIAIGFFCPMGFLKADMSLKSSHGVLKFGYFDFLLGGIERWVSTFAATIITANIIDQTFTIFFGWQEPSLLV